MAKELPTAKLAWEATLEARSMPLSASIDSIKMVLEEITRRAEDGYGHTWTYSVSPVQKNALEQLGFRVSVQPTSAKIEWEIS